LAILPDHKVTCIQLSSSLAVKRKVTAPLTATTHDKGEVRITHDNVGT